MATDDFKPTKLLWVDLEMTGLDPNADLILEIAAEVTDFNLKTLTSYEATVNHPREQVLARMQLNNWWADFPANRDEFLAKLEAGKPSSQVEQELIELVGSQFGNERVVLAGNSIYNDRAFIHKYWPNFDLKLHYRMLDVTAFKILFKAKYDIDYEKTNNHRAFDDVQASIAELQFYIEHINKSAP